MDRIGKPWLRALAGIAGAVLIVSACGTTEDKDVAGGGGPADCTAKLAFLGPQTGDSAGLGKPIYESAQLAIEEFNKTSDCKVEISLNDSQGSPDQAPALATEIVGDETVLGVIGPTFSGESDAAGPIFSAEGVPTISASATNPALSENGWDTFHRGLGNDATQGPAVARYIKNKLKAKAVFVIDDASEYGAGLAKIVEKDVGSSVVGTDTIQPKQTDFSATATKVTDSEADAVFFGGYYSEATILVGQLRDAGFKGTFLAADGVKDPAFLDAKKAAEGAVLTCPCIPDTDPAVAKFAKKYQAKYGSAPGTYAAEAWDATQVFLAGVKSGVKDRKAMLDFVNNYDQPGITKRIKFDEKGEPVEFKIYSYVVKDGEITPEGEIE